ncbi:signal peptidase I SipW [Fictibacillus sp. KU28468]|uniref:signal peptidase I SipW n=1 Tax=Fictibacillus sp. KU28468 TaxID=2991053 RepID=UPI00223CBC31|nr:signal peptidase I [Fictibacillus sp. KU28468]UZJ80076.1 signal peptidase I [Fictibacillus sp. KU28468]
MKVLRIISRIASGMLVLCLILATTLAISSKLSGGTPKYFGQKMMLVLSGSMEPTIKTGSAIFIKELKNPTKLKKGDVITFYSPIKKNTIVTHRIKEVKGTGQMVEYITKGDNNQANDPLSVSPQNVLGKYSNTEIPYFGYVSSFLQSKKGLGIMLIIPGLLLILVEIISVWRLLSRWDKQKEKNAVA